MGTKPLTLALALGVMWALIASIKASRMDGYNFIKSNCGATRYPELCVQSLTAYAKSIQKSPRQLAQAALSVSLAQNRAAQAYVSRLARSARGVSRRDHDAMRDCVENMSDSVDRLSRSISEMGRVGRARSSFEWHVSNVQTWVSAALTDETTCADGLSGPNTNPRLRAAVKKRLTSVAQVTSNALALVNRYAQRRRP